MNDREYQAMRERPDVMLRGHVRATFSRLQQSRPDLAAEVRRILDSTPVEKPALHAGGAETDYLWLDLPLESIDEIIDELGSTEAGLVESGASSAEIESATELLDRWNRAQRLQRES